MGLASALSTALTGLTAAETTIDVVGNNLANSNTVGFKASEANFATQFLQTRSLGSKPSATIPGSGGTNPRQVGLGTLVAEITPNFAQGTIQISSNPMDLAIQGDGFFLTQSETGEELYTRNGIFKLNSQNQMVAITGHRVLGWQFNDDGERVEMLAPIEVPLGSEVIAEPTENVYLQGLLSPTGDRATTAEIIETGVLSDAAYGRPDVSGTSIGSPATPDVTATTATPSFAAGSGMTGGETYQYRVVYYDPDTQSEGLPSNSVSVTLAAGDNRVDLGLLPSDGSGIYTQQRIYRNTVLNPSTFYLVATQDNAAGFVDNLDDATISLPGNPTLDTNLLNGTYTYHVTFFDAAGIESRPSAALEATVVNGGVQLQDLPIDTLVAHPGAGWIGRYVYRNVPSVNGNQYHRIATINDAGSVNWTYTDHVADASVTGNPQLDFDGPEMQSSTLLTNVLQRERLDYDNAFEAGTLEFSGKKGLRGLAPKTMTISATTTVADLVEFMEQAMGIQSPPGPDPLNQIPSDAGSGSPAGGYVTGGKIRFISNNGMHNALDIEPAGMRLTTASGTDNVNMGFGSVQSAIGESTVTSFVAYDSLGSEIGVSLTMVLESRDGNSVTYRWFADSPYNQPEDLTTPVAIPDATIAVGTGLITFDSTGKFLSASEDTVSINRRDTPADSPLVFDLDFTAISALETPESTLSVSRQDGSGAGSMTSFIVGEDGIIRGVFSNGVNRELAQIVLARFANPNGLEQRGENMFVQGVNSGEPVKGPPGTEGRGSIIAGAVELSNTDIGSNLIDLILASTMYRGNTRVITTAQQLFDELLSLRR